MVPAPPTWPRPAPPTPPAANLASELAWNKQHRQDLAQSLHPPAPAAPTPPGSSLAADAPRPGGAEAGAGVLPAPPASPEAGPPGPEAGASRPDAGPPPASVLSAPGPTSVPSAPAPPPSASAASDNPGVDAPGATPVAGEGGGDVGGVGGGVDTAVGVAGGILEPFATAQEPGASTGPPQDQEGTGPPQEQILPVGRVQPGVVVVTAADLDDAGPTTAPLGGPGLGGATTFLQTKKEDGPASGRDKPASGVDRPASGSEEGEFPGPTRRSEVPGGVAFTLRPSLEMAPGPTTGPPQVPLKDDVGMKVDVWRRTCYIERLHMVDCQLQGYLAHKQHRPPRTLQ